MRFSVRPAVSLALCGLLAATIGLVPALTVPAAAATPVSSVDFEDESTGEWVANGSPVLDYVTDGTVLSITRAADYEGIALGGVFTGGETYTFSMKARLEDGAADAGVRFVATDDSTTWDWVGNTTVTDGEWTTVTGQYTFPAGDASGWKVFIGSANADPDEPYALLIDDVTVVHEDGSGGGDPDPEPCELETVEIAAFAFDAGIEPWSGRGASVEHNAAEGDAAAGSIEVTGRTANWNGAQLDVTSLVTEGTYTVTSSVKLVDSADDGAELNMGMQTPGADNEYPWVGNRTTVTAGEWVELSGQYTVDGSTPPSVLYFESGGSLADFLVDDVTITQESSCDGGGDGPPPGTIAFSTDFENGGLDGWEFRDNGADVPAGAPTPGVELSTAYAQSPDHSAAVVNRTSQGHGIRIEVTELLETGTQYEVTASFRFADGEEPGDIWMSLQNGESTFSTLGQFSGMSNSGWVTVTGEFTMPSVADGDQAWVYFETAYDGGAAGNTSTFYVDDISAVVPEPPVVQDLTPLKDTVPFPMGVAIDSRETVGAPAELLLKHFDQITPENFMKPEAWYDADGNWAPNSSEIDALMDFAQDNDLGLYGHVLVWHSQTPDFFFQHDDGTWLDGDVPADRELLRSRMEEHIDNVAEYLSAWGEFGGDNPVVAFDVVNEVIDDSAAYADGMRRSYWYQILGETFVDDAFHFAEQAFNVDHAAPASDRPVTLFINDYNTEQSGKRGRYLGLIQRLLTRGAPIDGIGHQFHVNLSLPVSNLEQAIVDAQALGLIQAVTELDVTTGVPESEAKFIDQGYYYRDAFEIFRTYADDLYCATVWGLIDSRSWRDDNGGPLVFDDGFQAKPAYYGIVNGDGGTAPLPPRLRTANVFSGSVALDGEATASPVWERLPLLPLEGHGDFQFRWAEDHLTVFVTVADSTADASDGLEFTVGTTEYAFGRGGSGDVDGVVTETSAGYDAVVHLPLAAAAEGDTVEFDARIVDGADSYGWNTPGVTGTLTLVEELSYTEVPETEDAPVIDGDKESLWSSASSVETLKEVSGTGGAIGTFYTLWKDSTLYIYAEIADDVIDVSGSDPWIQDSVEIYVDGGNFKNGAYRYDDTQIRINAENVVSFGTGDETFQANRVDSATSPIDGGYAVEAAISLLEYGGEGTFHGIDVQVNDATAGARDAIRNWADPTGAGYQSTARWGVAQLVAGEDGKPGNGGGSSGGSNGGGNPGGGPGNGNGAPPFLNEDGVLELPNGKLVAPGSARPGQRITLGVGTQHSGMSTSTVMYSEPTLIGTGMVSPEGTLSVTIPVSTTPGEHTIAVYDTEGNVLGWAPISIVAADGGLSDTGAPGFQNHVAIALLLLLAGGAMVLSARRRGATVR